MMFQKKPAICVKDKFVSLRIDSKDITHAGIVTVPKLAEEITSQEESERRSCMIRHEWPLNVRYHGRCLVDRKEMREASAYQALTNLLTDEIETASLQDQVIVPIRFNIPMNLSTGWYEHETGWIVHKEDYEMGRPVSIDRKQIIDHVPYILVVNVKTGRLRAAKSDYLLKEDETAIMTSVIGYHDVFQQEAFFESTYDSRHIVNTNYDRSQAAQKDLVQLASSFLKRDKEYTVKIKEAIGRYGWSCYPRTVIVASAQDDQAIESYQFIDSTPVEIADQIMRMTEIREPVIFGCTEDKSFGIGAAQKREDETSMERFGRRAEKARPDEAAFVLYLQTNKKVLEDIQKVAAILVQKGQLYYSVNKQELQNRIG